MRTRPDRLPALRRRTDGAREKGLASLVAFQTTRWFGDAFRAGHADVVQACLETFLANDVVAYVATCRMLESFDLGAGLVHLTMPVDIVVGEENYAPPPPAMAEAMKAAIPHAAYPLLPKARHPTPLERPDEVSEEIFAVIGKAHGNAQRR